jgi:diadenosine tetraphosphate (Ap4A) HIT family hydrolase
VRELRQAAESGSGARAASGLTIAELPTAMVVLSPDQYYRGYSLVVAKTHATELFHLEDNAGGEYFRDMLRVAKAISDAFAPMKMNYELLGNTVPHLHWHVVPRYDWDPNPKRPIWEHQHDLKLLDSAQYAEIIEAIRAKLV